MQNSILVVFLFISTIGHTQTNVFGHYETPSVSKQLLHLRPDSTYVLYFVSDIGPFPRPKYEDIEKKPYKYINGQIYLLNETTDFDSIFVLKDSLNLVPRSNPNTLLRRIFHYDDGTIKYKVDPVREGYEIRFYNNNSLISIDSYEDYQMNGKHLEYFPMKEPLNSFWGKLFERNFDDSLDWHYSAYLMESNLEYQSKKSEGHWYQGKKDGLWKYYNKNGRLILTEKYRKGELKKTR